MSLPIEDYALIGDLHTAALAGNDGSIDWLCLPRFDSPACFAALLGESENGRWLLAPAKETDGIRRRYRTDSLILETEYTTDQGVVVVTDFMARRGGAQRADLVRIVQGKRGAVTMYLELRLRFDYGRITPWVRRQPFGLQAVAGMDAAQFRSPVELVNKDYRSTALFPVAAGQTIAFSLTWYPAHHCPPEPRAALALLEETENWWRAWSRQLRYEGPWRDEVMRSLITLKALIYEPTGGIVAAPTTSLPEKIGGLRNWDYRYCWLRDATFTLYALLQAGYADEAFAWRDWLLRAVAGRPERIQIMYGLGGERRLNELELPWLNGYLASRPVRIGNEAHGQIQLDTFGEVMDLFHVARRARFEGDDDAWRVQKALLDCLEQRWQGPEHGIWEIRGEPQCFTHSKIMAWVGVDRCIKTVEEFKLTGDIDRWRLLRRFIHDDVCRNGFDRSKNSFVQYYGGTALDAALLVIPAVGFLPATDPRVTGTIAAIERELLQDCFVLRYRSEHGVDGLPSGEGAFLACSFWLADAYVMAGRHDEARGLFERLLAIRNDVGLLAEEYDPVSRRQLGNFPQAFSHIALINTARNLSIHEGPARDRAASRGSPRTKG
ncbi:MAG TPA: glycoside hydrolase family 15 protein [Gammaproteobacteria bacterium]|nr:glycoside hydrolase family 15 protein [Gammaproteobacteria bacterium]